MPHGQQLATQVATVDGGYIHGCQRFQRLRVVPVEEVPLVPSHFQQRLYRVFNAVGHFLGSDPAKLPGAGHTHQVQANVGGGSPVRHHVVRHRLQIVGGQVMVGHAYTAFEQAPGVFCNAEQVAPVAGSQGRAFIFLAGRAEAPGPNCRSRPAQAEKRRKIRVWGGEGQQRHEDQACSQSNGPVSADQYHQFNRGLCFCRSHWHPLKEFAAADCHPVEGSEYRIC